jgi:hypothetical protein
MGVGLLSKTEVETIMGIACGHQVKLFAVWRRFVWSGALTAAVAAFIGGGCFSCAWALPSYDDVLVVINTQSADSVNIGRYFQQQRMIPERNVCQISLTPRVNTARMTVAERDYAVSAIQSHMASNGLYGTINNVVLTTQIGYFAYNDMPNAADNHIFDCYLMLKLSDPGVDVFSLNPFYHYIDNNWNNLTEHAFSRRKYGFPIVSRLDGPGTVNIRKMIDATGGPAYDSYTNGIRYLVTYETTAALYRTNTNEKGSEFLARGNILLNEDFYEKPKGLASEPIMDESKIMFAYMDLVSETGIEDPPFIFYDLNFLPGSTLNIFRSFPTRNLTRQYGGVARIQQATKARTYFRRDDGEDLAYRHLETLAVDPGRNRVWAATGEKQDNVLSVFDLYTNQRRGNGLVVMDADSGGLVAYYTAENSGLLHNRVVKVAFDPYHDRIWVASYGGIQYVDLTDNSFHAIAGLTADYAAAYDVFVSPCDTTKVFASFLYEGTTSRNSTIVNANRRLFEIDKATDVATSYQISTANGYRPLIAQTESNTLWNVRGKTLVRFDRATQTAVNTIDLTALIGSVDYPRALLAHTNSFGERQVFLAVANPFNSASARTNYLVRVVETGPATVTTEVMNRPEWNDTTTTAGSYRYFIRHLAADPTSPDHIYMVASKQYAANSTHYGQIFRSTDGRGQTWETWIATTSGLNNFNELAFDGKGRIFAAQGYHDNHLNASDFMASGACSVGGGLSHDNMVYNRAKAEAGVTSAHWIDPTATSRLKTNHANGAYSSDWTTHSIGPLMYKMLDGYGVADARFATRYQPSASGSGGYEPHTLVMEPKVSPFGPRVDRVGTALSLSATNTVSARLFSPGLPVHLDGFVSGTVSLDTLALFDDKGTHYAASAVSYDAATQRVRYQRSADLAKGVYYLSLRGGRGGIKNTKGGALVNVLPDECRDETVLRFEVGGLPGNAAPAVFAGADRHLDWPEQVLSLIGAVSDDGQPNAVPTLAWTKASGPGTVIFGAAAAAETSATFSAPGTYVLRLSANDGDMNVCDELLVLVRYPDTPRLLAHWDFEEAGGTAVYDVSGGGKTGALGGGAGRGTGRAGKGLYLTGSNSRADCGTAVSFSALERLTLSAWVYPEQVATATRGRTVASALGVGPRGWAPGWNLGAASMDDRLTFSVGDEEGGRAVVSADRFFTDRLNQWSHLVAVYEGGQYVALYVNGVQVNQTTQDVPARLSLESGTRLMLGRKSGGGDALYGRLDEVKYYNYALSDTEIAALYAEVLAENQAPVVEAGVNLTVSSPTSTVQLAGTVSDDGIPALPGTLSAQWSQVSGPEATFADARFPETTARLSDSGTYVFRLSVSDGEKTSSDDVTVTLLPGAITTNFALGKPASASTYSISGSIYGYPYNAVDGDRTGINSKWLATMTLANKWWEVDLGSAVTVDEVRLYCQDSTANVGTIYDFTITAYNGASTTVVYTFTGNTQPTVICRFAPVTATKLRLTVQSHASGGIELYEFEAYRTNHGTVDPAFATPAITLSAPADNSVVNLGQSVTLSATASGAVGEVTNVAFYSGFEKVAQDAAEPYAMSWTPTRAGVHTLTARLTDSYGRTSRSASRTLTVNGAPAASVARPLPNAVFLQGETVRIVADVADPDGAVTNIGFLADGGLLVTRTLPNSGYDWSGAALGAHQIRVLATDQYGLSVTSAPVAVTVVSAAVAPQIVREPEDVVAQAGKPAVFEVQATGTTLSYQWHRDGATVPGATGYRLELPSTTGADDGAAFYIVVSNTAGTVASRTATLTVDLVQPVIVTGPQDATVALGQTATFSVSASGSTPLFYQWNRNGTIIPSATDAVYRTPPAAETDHGVKYQVTVTNAAGSAQSALASLNVLGALVGHWRFNEGAGVTACDASGFGHDGTLTSTSSVPPVWTLGYSGGGLEFDSAKGQYVRISGTPTLHQPGAVTVMAWVRDAAPNSQLSHGVRTGGGSIYRFNLNPMNLYLRTEGQGWHNGGTGPVLNWAGWHHVAWSYDAATGMTRFHFDGQEVYASATVSAGLMDGALDELRLGGNENSRYMHGGMDEVKVFVRALSQTEIADAARVGLVGFWPADEPSGDIAYDASGFGNHGALTSGALRVAGKIGGALQLDRAQAQSLVADNVPVNLNDGGCNTVCFWMNWGGSSGQMPFGWNTSYDLYLASEAFGFNTGQGNILGVASAGLESRWVHVAAVFPNGDVKTRAKLYVDGVAQTLTDRLGSETTASKSATPRVIFSNWGAAGSYHFTGKLDDMRIYDRELTAQEVATVYAESVEGTPPAITAQPQDNTVMAGAQAHFSAEASGTAPLFYQWQRSGQDISGATGASYLLAETGPADDGAGFRLIVANPYGSVTSRTATLTVQLEAPQIVTPPQSQTVNAGTPVLFEVTVSGTEPMFFQWLRDGTTLSGATGASYTLSAAGESDHGAVFSVSVSNVLGVVTSDGAVLTVVDPTRHALPYAEPFESFSSDFLLSGWGGWRGGAQAGRVTDDAALLAALHVYAAPVGYPLRHEAHGQAAVFGNELTNRLAAAAGEAVWCDLMVELEPAGGPLPAEPAEVQCTLAVDATGRLCVWHRDVVGGSNRWSVLAWQTPQSSQWARVTLHLDYATADAMHNAHYFRLFIDGEEQSHASGWNANDGTGTPGGTWFALAGGMQERIGALVFMGSGALDDLTVGAERPLISLGPQGTPEWWLADNGLTNGLSLAENEQADADLDGFANWKEYAAGTGPTEAASLLRFIDLPETENGRLGLVVQTVPGRRYTLEACADLVTPVWETAAFALTQEGTTAIQTVTAEAETLTLFVEAGTTSKFYRVQAVQ